MIQADLTYILPEVCLRFTRCWRLLGLSIRVKTSSRPLLVWLHQLGYGSWLRGSAALGPAKRRPLAVCLSDDGFAAFAKVTILFSAAAVLVMSEGLHELARVVALRVSAVVVAVVGMMVMVSAGDLMALYMGLELQSLALYVIAALRRD